MNETIEKILNHYREDARSNTAFLGKSIVLSLIMIAADITVDLLLPTNKIWMNCIRTMLALISSYPFFCFGYSIIMRQHDGNVSKARANDEDYVDYRLRYSPAMRMRQSAVFAAFLALLAIVSSYTAIYTLSAGVIIASVFGILGYCRLSDDEMVLQKAQVPDPRDVMEAIDKAEDEINKAAREELKKSMVEERKKQMKAEDDLDDDDLDEEDEDNEDEDLDDLDEDEDLDTTDYDE